MISLDDPTMLRRIIDDMPVAIAVVDADGNVVLTNRALLRLVRRTVAESERANFPDYIHADDLDWLMSAFASLLTVGTDTEADPSAPLAPIHVRLVGPDGEEIPVEVTGSPMTGDVTSEQSPAGGIFTLVPSRYNDLLRYVLAGVASGAEVPDLLALVIDLIALPPLTLSAAILELDGAESSLLLSSSEALAAAIEEVGPLPGARTAWQPARYSHGQLGPSAVQIFENAGFRDMWHVSIHSTNDRRSYEIIVGNPYRPQVSPGVRSRLEQARELAGVVMVRARSDRLLREAAERDDLTDTLNRAAFRQRVAARLDAVDQQGTQRSWLLFLDLDGFKPVNDRYGHAAGDAVLQIVAQRLRNVVRRVDSIARLGGDEFAVLIEPTGAGADHFDVESTSQRIVDSIQAPIRLNIAGDGVIELPASTVTASIGVTTVRADDSVDDVLGRADRLMYEAKRDGGSQLRIDAPAS